MIIQKQSLLTWYLIVCVQALIGCVAVFFDMHHKLWELDQTKLSFIIIAVWVFGTGYVGWLLKNTDKTLIKNNTKIGWYLAETCLALGLLGTVAGFLLMLGNAFTDIDVSNTESLQKSLSEMALGMSTALYTTLVGIISSIFLKSQLVNLEHYTDGLR